MAVAGINNVSVLESSYFGDNYSPVSRRWGNQEKPITRTSFIRKLWRDLEDETKIRETERKHMRGITNSKTESRCSYSSEDAESETMSITTSEAENECPWDQNQMVIQNEQEDNQKSCFQHSPAIGTADKERVRQVFREWGSKNNYCSRGQSTCEDESKRVRTVRRWLESNNQQAETGQSVVQEQDRLGVTETRIGAQRSIRRLYGRHALVDLLTRFQMERKEEMQSLLECRAVSSFAHRKRIQTLLKGRFLWNQRFVHEEKSSSNAASELGLLRQTQTVSDLRKGFLSKVNTHEQVHDALQSDTSSNNGMKDEETQLLHDIVNESGSELQQPQSTENFENRDREEECLVEVNQGAHALEPSRQSMELESLYESDGDELENEAFDHLNSLNQGADHIEPYESDGDELEEETLHHLTLSETYDEASSSVRRNQGAHNIEPCQHQQSMELKSPYESETDTESVRSLNANSVENPNEWLVNQETVHDGWYDSHHPVVTTDAFYTHDVDDYDGNNTRLELHQLATRRRVSNLLESDFRVRLDRVLQSHLERQDDQASESDEEDWILDDDDNDNDNENENDEADEDTQPADGWQNPGTEWEIINGLRMDMLQLHERVNSMQSTLETCMKMQLELQQSVQQEVSSALNRSSNLGAESLQACVLCCDSGFDNDSSHNRCGNVYVCSNCAEKINWSKLKESVRRP